MDYFTERVGTLRSPERANFKVLVQVFTKKDKTIDKILRKYDGFIFLAAVYDKKF